MTMNFEEIVMDRLPVTLIVLVKRFIIFLKKHIGFKSYKRTDCDEQGRPFPLIYMRLYK